MASNSWSSGDVKHYHREGYRLDCMVNVDADSAVVRCETTAHPPLVRTLLGDTVSRLQPEGPNPSGGGEVTQVGVEASPTTPSSCSRPATTSINRKSTRLNSSHGSISYAVF